MSAYTSFDNYKEDMQIEKQQREQTKQEQAEHLAMILSHRFLVPDDPKKSDEQLLSDALQLSKQDDFKRKRADFFKWQEDIIEQGISDKKAIEEMEEYLKQYNDVVRKANAEVKLKFVFLLIKLALGLPGILLGQIEPIVSNTMDVISYFRFDKKLNIDAGDCKSAAMLHDVDKQLKWNT